MTLTGHHATAPESRMEPAASMRRPHAARKEASPVVSENGSQHCRSGFERVPPRRQVGAYHDNPVSNSEPPVPKKHRGIALLPTEQFLLIDSATGPWCLPMFLELSAATGARRGEVLALRWSDIEGSDVVIARSLTQTKGHWNSKGTKTGATRRVGLPESVLYDSRPIGKSKMSSGGNLVRTIAPIWI